MLENEGFPSEFVLNMSRVSARASVSDNNVSTASSTIVDRLTANLMMMAMPDVETLLSETLPRVETRELYLGHSFLFAIFTYLYLNVYNYSLYYCFIWSNYQC